MVVHKHNLGSLVANIEQAVQDRRRRDASLLIQALPSYFRDSSKNRIQLSEWWRRLGDNDRAIKVLQVGEGTNLSINHAQIDEWIHLLKLLNNLGLSRYALRVADRIQEHCIIDQHRYDLGQIYLTNFAFQKALNCFESICVENFPHPKVYLLKISIADCLAGLTLLDKAIALADSVFKDTNKSIFKAISATAKAEYLFKGGNYRQALETLLPWESFFNIDRKSVDFLLWSKWLGLSKLALGFYEDANHYLQQAYQGLKSYKPEGISDILYWQWLLETNEKKKQDLSYKLALGCHYLEKSQKSSLGDQIQASYLISKEGESIQVKCCDRQTLSPPKSESSHLFIDAIDRAYIMGGKYRLSDTLSLKLAHILGLSAIWGEVSKWRAIDLIYDEVTIPYQSLEERFKKVLKDCRNRFFPIRMQNNSLKVVGSYQLISKSYHGKESTKTIVGGSFLRNHSDFTVVEILDCLNIKKTKAYELIELWKNAKLIHSIKPGEYHVQTSPC